jgi:hypothetical protein
MKKLYFLSISVLSMAFSGISQIADPSFETGPTGTAWTQTSTNFMTPLCDAAGCGTCGGPCVPNSGTWYAWFGGAGGNVEIASLEQSAVVPSGTTASINMMVKIPSPAGNGAATDGIIISVDGAPVGTITSADSTTYAGYTMASFPINTAANGMSHVFNITGGQAVATGANFNLLIDDITLTVNGTTVSLFEFETGENEVIIFPNPAKEIINLQFRNVSGDVDVKIVDLAGKNVSNQKVAASYASAYVLNTSDLNNGSYIMTVYQDGNVLRTENIVINK